MQDRRFRPQPHLIVPLPCPSVNQAGSGPFISAPEPSGMGTWRDHPAAMLASDGAYVSKARLPTVPKRGFVPMAPDIAIEVKSPDDTWEETVEKCGLWIAHGAGVVWAVHPDAHKVAVFRANGESEVLSRDGLASAEPALPGFAVELSEIFDGL